jgi:hypothetical protein
MYYVQGMHNEIICCEAYTISLHLCEKIPDFSDAVMPSTSPVTFRNRVSGGTDTHSLSSGIT